MKTFSNKPLKAYNGEEIKVPMKDGESVELSTEFRHILLLILNNCEMRAMDDSIQGVMLAQAIDSAKGKRTLEMEEGVHKWLKKKAEQVCPSIFRVNGEIVYEFIKEGFEKVHQPEKEKEK